MDRNKPMNRTFDVRTYAMKRAKLSRRETVINTYWMFTFAAVQKFR